MYPMTQLSISNLSKTYSNGVKALDHVSLDIPRGMFGLLGPNGSGKSTLMRTIATLQEADEGSISLGDLDLLKEKEEVRKILGYLPQEFGLYPKVSAEVLLNHLAVLKGLTKKKERQELVRQLLHQTNLYDDRKKKLGGFSGGMKQRFGIAQALLTNPQLLIVDEPTAGLDPVERNRFYKLLCELGEHCIIILSTHIVQDVKELCSKMAIIRQGKVLVQGSPLDLMEEVQGKVYKKQISVDELEDYKQEFKVIADRLLMGQPIIHIYSEHPPGNGFIPLQVELEEVYFSHVFGK